MHEDLLRYLKEIAPIAKGVIISPQELVFEENVKMNCFYCGRYGNNWRCPPNLPALDYQKMTSEFDKGMFVVYTCPISKNDDYAAVRNESSIALHRTLLELEKWMWNHNKANALSFIGGSCKLCKGGCGKEKCNNPYQSRSPLEAIGVNVVKSAAKYGIDIHFPTKAQIIRCGLILWQED